MGKRRCFSTNIGCPHVNPAQPGADCAPSCGLLPLGGVPKGGAVGLMWAGCSRCHFLGNVLGILSASRILNIVLGRMFYRLTHAEIVSTSDWKLSKFIQILNRGKLVRS